MAASPTSHGRGQSGAAFRWSFLGIALIAAILAIAAIALVTGRGGASGSEAAGADGNGGNGAAFQARRQRPPAVALARVEFAPVERTLSAIGAGRALQSVELNAEVAGIVAGILVEPGQRVKKGEPLLKLDSRAQEIALAKARAEYAIAKTNAERFSGLVADEAASALELEAAQNAYAAARAALRQAEYELDRRTVRAPFDGVVGLVDLDVGDFLTVGARIATVDNVSALLVDFAIPEAASTFVRPGLEFTASAPAAGGRAFAGTIRAIDSRIDPVTRTRRVEGVLVNEDQALVPGATFAISISAPGERAVKAPGLAVQWDRAGAYVWKLSANGVAQRTPVTILQRTADSVLLDAPLTGADYIVAEGADIVRAGMPLPRPDEAARAGDANAAAGYR
ncbi:efflux RND transporter periplasmic adaptor subunit [Amphiplicatus metriothermophilus]|uniref:RND family efflux transporter, MFP subunit n=1 Tax=Amphiplicatus metriothermophilus TaxID=1519374 RepID=A0A239PX40_9PROT|nr:efflux RND transporter periplasmic adaptor subunit [Amphiplicatus metriothermophilus]MBB5520002.1 RND family efflux transporter MFP subunit [Amphiplicatus metriothermophilus]SNT74901.1 RND family efflux transporter, MFP subunit [Amphiplicatus metriothermophilus]